MKKGILFLSLIISMLFMTACSENAGDVSIDTSSATSTDEKTYTSESEASTRMDEVEKEGEMKLNITVGDQIFTATLENNQTEKAFTALLPLTIDMEDVNGNEKYYVLPESVRGETEQNPETIHTGDIMCYGNAGLVLFYETFSTSYSYVTIGHIDDTEGLVEALGTDDIQVTFSIQ